MITLTESFRMTATTLRIAVADDEPDVRDYFRVMLPRLGHTVVAVATNGREFVEFCKQHNPDLIIADVRMPELDGDAADRADLLKVGRRRLYWYRPTVSQSHWLDWMVRSIIRI